MGAGEAMAFTIFMVRATDVCESDLVSIDIFSIKELNSSR